MKHFYQIGEETFCCASKARSRLTSLMFDSKQNGYKEIIELWEVKEEEDIFGNVRTMKYLVTRFTPNLPNNGMFRIHDVHDIRRAKKMYALQKYNRENHAWENYKMGSTVEELQQLTNSIMQEVKG